MDLDRLARCLAVFATLDPIHLPLHHAQLLVEVARNEPCTFTELGEALGITNGSVSRSVSALGEVNRRGDLGYRLLQTAKDPREPRRFLVSLSPRGRALLRQLESL